MRRSTDAAVWPRRWRNGPTVDQLPTQLLRPQTELPHARCRAPECRSDLAVGEAIHDVQLERRSL
jgi:hypothetical protein